MSLSILDTSKITVENVRFLTSVIDDTMPFVYDGEEKTSSQEGIFILLADVELHGKESVDRAIRDLWPHRLCQRITTIVEMR